MQKEQSKKILIDNALVSNLFHLGDLTIHLEGVVLVGECVDSYLCTVVVLLFEDAAVSLNLTQVQHCPTKLHQTQIHYFDVREMMPFLKLEVEGCVKLLSFVWFW